VREQRSLALRQTQTSARGDSDDGDDHMEDQDSFEIDTLGEHYYTESKSIAKTIKTMIRARQSALPCQA
jgi:hypothetical protein